MVKLALHQASNTSLDKFSQELSGSVVAFKASQLCLSQKVVELKPTAAAVDSLQAFPFLNKATVLGWLKDELTTYLAKANGIDPGTDPLVWWKAHSSDLPHWSAAAADILLVPKQDASLNDYIEAALMLQYNNH